MQWKRDVDNGGKNILLYFLLYEMLADIGGQGEGAGGGGSHWLTRPPKHRPLPKAIFDPPPQYIVEKENFPGLPTP